MRATAKYFLFAALALGCLLMAARGQAQSIPLGYATNFSSVAYFEPPNDQQIKLRLSGVEALPLPGTLFDLKQLKVEKFNSEGKLEAVVHAPQCIFAPLDGLASSPGHLDLNLDDDRIHVQGEGFLWQQNESSLVISNKVRTTIKMGTWKLTTP